MGAFAGRGGAEILVPIEDWIGRTLYYFGDLDPKITWVLKRILRPGDTVLDIGANVGLVSIIARQIVGNNGKVHAFEPQPTLVDLMYKSLEKNGYSDVVIHKVALGVEKEEKELFIPEGHFGAASLIRESFKGNKISVRVENATTYLASLGLPPIRLVKMDVEGYEAEIIKGAWDFFETNRPDAILFELNDHSVPFFQQPVIGLLSELGYQFLNIRKSKLKMRLCRINSSTPSKQYGHDILAAPTGQIYDEIARLVGS